MRTVEALLRFSLDAAHADDRARHTAALAAAVGELADDTVLERLAALTATRLPDHEAAALMAGLAATARHLRTAPATDADPVKVRAVGKLLRTIRVVTALLLDHEARNYSPYLVEIVFDDLDEVRLDDPAAGLGPYLARTVLDIAAADAAARVALAERTEFTARLTGPNAASVAAGARLADRLLAAHRDHTAPAAAGDVAAAGEYASWWQQMVDLAARLPRTAPAPEAARALETAVRTCPPEHRDTLHAAPGRCPGLPGPRAVSPAGRRDGGAG
ncbi:hypothetical protein [Kitasatospora sp. NPDC056181]|uniref:hypothetical protein n=1 Tax=Kitasatospora sp. NPDC056181 TaxID=3345737 RepID=UPI0035DDD03B